MKRFISILIVFVIAFTACDNNPIPVVFDFNGMVNVKYGEVVNSEDNNHSLEIIEINDSRCASDVTCVWEGEARISLELRNNGVYTFELSTLEPKIDTVDNIIFRLVEVDPYPVSTVQLELDDYVIKLEVEEL